MRLQFAAPDRYDLGMFQPQTEIWIYDERENCETYWSAVEKLESNSMKKLQ